MSQLKRYVSGIEIIKQDLPPNTYEGFISVQPQQVLQQQTILGGNKPVDQVLIQWEGAQLNNAHGKTTSISYINLQMTTFGTRLLFKGMVL